MKKTYLIFIILLMSFSGTIQPIVFRQQEIDSYVDKAYAGIITPEEIQEARAAIAQFKTESTVLGYKAEMKFNEALKTGTNTSLPAQQPQTSPRAPQKITPTPTPTPEPTPQPLPTKKKEREEKIAAEYENFEDIKNDIETALSEIESLIEQVPGVEDAQNKKETIELINDKITDLQGLFNLLRKKSCGAKQQQIRKKLFKRYQAAQDALNDLASSQSQDQKHVGEKNVHFADAAQVIPIQEDEE